MDLQKCPGVRYSWQGWQGRGCLGLCTCLSAAGKTASDAGEADSWPCSPGIYGQQCKRGSFLPAWSALRRALPHPLPNTVNQKTGSFPVPAVLLFPRPLIPRPPSNPPPPLQTYPPHPNFLPLQTSHVNRSHSWCLVLFQRVQVGLWPGGGTFEINFMSNCCVRDTGSGCGDG